MPAPPIKDTPKTGHYTYRFILKDNGGKGTYVTDADTVEEAWRELEVKYGVRLYDVWT